MHIYAIWMRKTGGNVSAFKARGVCFENGKKKVKRQYGGCKYCGYTIDGKMKSGTCRLDFLFIMN
jgi:hypothetical protein